MNILALAQKPCNTNTPLQIVKGHIQIIASNFVNSVNFWPEYFILHKPQDVEKSFETTKTSDKKMIDENLHEPLPKYLQAYE